MRILFDHGTPAPLIPFLTGHTVTKAWRIVQLHVRKIASAVNAATAGTYTEIDIPFI